MISLSKTRGTESVAFKQPKRNGGFKFWYLVISRDLNLSVGVPPLVGACQPL